MFELPLIDKAFIIENSSYSSYMKGLDYYKKGYVKKVWVSGTNTVSARVEGTRLYNVEIDFHDRKITARCDCPYELDDYCKHIAAALVYSMENIDDLRLERKKILESDTGGALIASKKIDSLLAAISKSGELESLLREFFNKYPESFEKFALLRDFMNSRKSSPQNVGRAYSAAIEAYAGKIRKEFENADFYKAEKYIPGRKSKGGAFPLNDGVVETGYSEFNSYFEENVDSIMDKFYVLAAELLKIGDSMEAAKIIMSVNEFAVKFPENINFSGFKLEGRIFDKLTGCVKFHAQKSFLKLVELAGSEMFSRENGDWFYGRLVSIYFGAAFSEWSRSEKFSRLKFICRRHGAAEHMHDFIIENFANNYNPMTGETFYVTAENAHECFYLLDMAGESGKAVKIAEKYWRQNIILHSEYIEFLIKHMEYRKALKFSKEVVGSFESGAGRLKSLKYDELQEQKDALATAVHAIDGIYSPMINSASSKSKKAGYISFLYRTLYVGLLYNQNVETADRIINVIETAESLGAGNYRITHLERPVTLENFAANIINEKSCDPFFMAKIFDKISRYDLIIAIASRASDDYEFLKISSFLTDSRPAEAFEMFAARINNSIANKYDANSYNRILKMLSGMSKIKDMQSEFREFLNGLRMKYKFKKIISGEMNFEIYADGANEK